MKKRMVFFALLLLCQISTYAMALTIEGKRTLSESLFNLYAPEVNRGLFLMGGWRNWDDYPEDKIIILAQYGQPIVLGLDHAHINDPSLISTNGGFYLYYTRQLFSEPAMTIGMAKITRQGILIQNFGSILGNPQKCGAWSPGTVKVNNEIWVYYHKAAPCVGNFRQRISSFDGRSLIGEEQEIDTSGQWIVNVDVARKSNGTFLMVGDYLNTLPGFQDIHILKSTDGEHWIPYPQTKDGALIHSSETIGTPTITSVKDDKFSVIFSTWPEGFNGLHTTLEKWDFRE